MPKQSDLEKSWIPASSRGTFTFNAPGNLTIPYGRYKATVSGKGSDGSSPVAATWNTNYNTTYPTGNQPIANRPAATWNTNYNTNYNVSYAPGNADYAGEEPQYSYYIYCNDWSYVYFSNWYGPQSGSGGGCQVGWWCEPSNSYSSPYMYVQNQRYCEWTGPVLQGYSPIYNTNYNVSYAVGNRPIGSQPAATWNTNYNTNYNTAYPVANQPASTYNVGGAGTTVNVLGVALPGGPPGNAATPVSPTVANPWTGSPTSPSTVAVTVPSNATVTVVLE